MAKSTRMCPNPHCRLYEKSTNLSVCCKCYRATVRSIYRAAGASIAA
jgi:hypothetical protein